MRRVGGAKAQIDDASLAFDGPVDATRQHDGVRYKTPVEDLPDDERGAGRNIANSRRHGCPVAEPIDRVSVRRIKTDALLNGANVWMRRVHAAVDHGDNDTGAGSSCERWIFETEASLQTAAFDDAGSPRSRG
jgi:hypothetical protein